MKILLNLNWIRRIHGHASLASEDVAEAITAAILPVLPDEGRFVVRKIVQDEDTVLEAVWSWNRSIRRDVQNAIDAWEASGGRFDSLATAALVSAARAADNRPSPYDNYLIIDELGEVSTYVYTEASLVSTPEDWILVEADFED
jgi:hypothetical protein